jgi:thiamine-phosphate pyrophosphorylase
LQASEAAAARPVLCLVTDRAVSRRPLAEAVAAAVSAGVDWVQIREKDLPGAELLGLTDAVAEAARRANPAVRVLVNRRIDVALAAALDGVHLGFDAAPPEVARRLLGEARLVGMATHAADETSPAEQLHLSYLLLAPIFPPLSKPTSRPPLGPAALARASCALPVLAQGGVEAANAGACLAAGAAGVAVTGAILAAADPGAAAAALRRSLDEAASAPQATRR